MRLRHTRSLSRLAAAAGAVGAVSAVVACTASAQMQLPSTAQRQSLPYQIGGPGGGAIVEGRRWVPPKAPLLLRADQPDRDPNNPDPVTGDPSIAHGHGGGAPVNGVSLSGVARLAITSTQGNFLCTGALVGPRTLLTAAHCVSDDLTGRVITAHDGVTARFYGPNGFVDYVSSAVRVSPYWRGFFNPLSWGGDDIAIVHFDTVAEPWMTPYDLYLGNPVFQAAMEVGYGTYGNGAQGGIGLDGRRRWGKNRVDFLSNDGVLWSDFDNGQVANDAWCWADNYTVGSPFCDTGFGAFESALAGGDSGGPLFIGGQLAGVASFSTYFCDPVLAGCQPAAPPLVDPSVPNGFGMLNGHAWAALNADYINQQIASIPEPTTFVLLGGGLVLLVGVARRRPRRSGHAEDRDGGRGATAREGH